MKALTLAQPWATLVAIGAKRFVAQSWEPAHLGPIAIHAGDGPDLDVADARELQRAIHALGDRACAPLPRGAVIAIARLRWAEPTQSCYVSEMLWLLGGPLERELGDFSPGRWAWYLEGARELSEPVPAQGAPGLWEWAAPEGLELFPIEARP